MNRLRFIFDWIVKRKFLSFLFFVLFVGIGLSARFIIDAYSGHLSEPIKRGAIIDAVYGYGTITTDRRFSFNSHLGRSIDKIFFKEGDIVKKGMPLLQTSDRVVVRAPFTGIIHYLPYKAREYNYAKERIMLTDITDRYVLVTLEQEEGVRVKIGQKVKIKFESIGQKYFSGKVSAMTSKAGRVLVRVDASDLPEGVLPGMTCNVDILIGERENVLLIPLSSLSNGLVWVKRGKGIPRKVRVGLGVIDKNWAEVRSGNIEAGDRVKIVERQGELSSSHYSR